ncbi:MAG: ABC transporter ATP-binding protein [Candidatus Hodarchaeales archaeon]
MNDNTAKTPLIVLKSVNRYYESGSDKITALKDISLEIEPGEFIIITGPSGSGKSTLLNIIAGIETPNSGTVRIFDRVLKDMNDSELCEIRRSRLGFIFQFFNIHPLLNVLENIELAPVIAGKKPVERDLRLNEIVKLAGIEHRKFHFPYELSGGEKQRVGIARALINDPEIILADEPTGDLDSTTSMEILSLIFDLNQTYGKTVIFVTHDSNMIKPGMRVIQMIDGTIISER